MSCARGDYARRQRPAINADSLCDLAIGSQMTVLGISDATCKRPFARCAKQVSEHYA